MPPRIIDITPPVDSGLAVWPDDVPFTRRIALDMARGDHLTLSSIETTVHLGAHADAPAHFLGGGRGIDEVALDPYVGPCEVVNVDVARGARVTPDHLADAGVTDRIGADAPRVLIRTGTFPDPRRFNEDFAALSPELIDWLHARGITLVGVDTPSVDPFASKVLEAHQALGRTGMANLEGLVLEHVEPGRYTLIALPLKLVGADASPVRAVLLGDED